MFDRLQLASKAQEALQRINANKAQTLKESNLNDINSFKNNKANLVKAAFEEYDESDFTNKTTIDSYFFKNLISNIPSQNLEGMVEVISQLYDNSQSIYEHINVKPRTYGFNLQTALNSSEEVLENQAKNYINGFLKDNYYKLTTEQRQEKFFPKIKPIAESLILENQLNETEALEYASKVVLMEELISHIVFPSAVQSYIEESLQDASYAEVFEAEELQEKWDLFKNQVYNVAKIVSMIV